MAYVLLLQRKLPAKIATENPITLFLYTRVFIESIFSEQNKKKLFLEYIYELTFYITVINARTSLLRRFTGIIRVVFSVIRYGDDTRKIN